MWHTCWRNLLLELRLLFPSTTKSALGSDGLVLGTVALLEPSSKIPGSVVCFRGRQWDIPGTRILRIHVPVLAPEYFSCCGETGPWTSINVPVDDKTGAGNEITGPGSRLSPGALGLYCKVLRVRS